MIIVGQYLPDVRAPHHFNYTIILGLSQHLACTTPTRTELAIPNLQGLLSFVPPVPRPSFLLDKMQRDDESERKINSTLGVGSPAFAIMSWACGLAATYCGLLSFVFTVQSSSPTGSYNMLLDMASNCYRLLP